MGYDLIPRNEGIKPFSANAAAYGTLLAICRDLCGPAFTEIRLRPPKGKPDYPLRTWFINDQLRVSGADAQRLGEKLQESLRNGGSDERVREIYRMRAEQKRPGTEEEEQIRKLNRKLADFAGFLSASGGFEIW